MQLLVDGEHGGDGDQQGGSQSAVQVGNDSDAGSGYSDHDDIGTSFFHQPVHHRIEQAHITHHGEVNDGEDEQDSGGPGLANSGFHEIEDLCRGKSANQSGNDRYHHEQRHRVGFTADQSDHDDHNHQKTNNAQEHNAFPPLRLDLVFPGRASHRKRDER